MLEEWTTHKMEEIDPHKEIVRLREMVLVLQQSQRDLSKIIFDNTARLWDFQRMAKAYIIYLEAIIAKDEEEDRLIRVMWRDKK